MSSQCELYMGKVNRFEVIDESGKVYSKWDCVVKLDVQDGGRTLKVFVKKVQK